MELDLAAPADLTAETAYMKGDAMDYEGIQIFVWDDWWGKGKKLILILFLLLSNTKIS